MTNPRDRLRTEEVRPALGRGELLLLSVIYFFATVGALVFRPFYTGAFLMPRGAGIGVAVLLVYGKRALPMLFIFSLLGRLFIHLLTGSNVHLDNLGADLAVAAVEVGTAYLVATLLRRLYGFPLSFTGPISVLRAAAILIPGICMVSVAVGIGLLQKLGRIGPDSLVLDWCIWWVGDALGIIVATPLILLWPSPHRSFIHWKGEPLPRFKFAALAYVVLSLLVTQFAWKAASTLMVRYEREQFATLVRDNRHALAARLQSYAFGLDGLRGLMRASGTVTLAEWRAYVGALNFPDHLRGIGGVGFIQPIARADVASYLSHVRDLGVKDLIIHPPSVKSEIFVIQYIEPLEPNAQALGLDISFEENRYQAAVAARDSGEMRITDKIALVQDASKGPGFLLLDPLYVNGAPVATPAERRAAFRGWVYAPFTASGLLSDLTSSQHKLLTLSAYSGTAVAPEALIYSNSPKNQANSEPRFHITSQVSVFGRIWTIDWQSTAAFENGLSRAAPLVTLGGGLAFSGLLALYLISLARREDKISAQVAARTRELAAQIEENRSIIQTPNANIALLDQDGRLLFTNESISRLFGYTSGELHGKELAWLLDGATAEYFVWSRQRTEPTGYRSEVRTPNRKGEGLVLDVQINAWTSVEDQRRYTALVTDVTDKRRVEEELRRTQHRLDVALSGAKIGVFEVDLATGTSIVSTTWKLLFGLRPDAEIDTQAEFLRRLHPDDRAIVETADRSCIEGRSDRSISEFRVWMDDGSWHWLRSEAVAGERDIDGRALRLIGAMTDITELVRSKEDLRESEERLRSAMDAAPTGTAIASLDGRLMKVNPALNTFVGMDQTEILERDLADLVHPDERKRLAELIQALDEGQAASIEAEIRCLRYSANEIEEEVWGKLSLALVRDAAGKARTLVIQIQDINEQKKLDRIKNEFVATVSHELRTPLTSINGSLALVLNGVAGDVPEKARKMLSIAHKNTSRLIFLVNDILDIEKLASGKMKFDLTETSLSKVIQQSLTNIKPIAEASGISFEFREVAGDIIAKVDSHRFQQVMTNLLSNAVKFSPANGRIDVETRPDGRDVRISVTDYGSGVPPEFRAKIFQAFSQADSSSTRAKEGTGLGLAISRQIVERMGGTIGFDSEPGQPTTFYFTLPMLLSSEQTALPPDRTVPNAGATANPVSEKPRILHVEADRDFAEIIAASFGIQAELTHVSNMDVAIDLVASRDFDLLLLDDASPDSARKRLLDAAVRSNPDVAVIALSANDGTVTDPRIRQNFIKTRTSVQSVVSACIHDFAERKRKASRAAE